MYICETKEIASQFLERSPLGFRAQTHLRSDERSRMATPRTGEVRPVVILRMVPAGGEARLLLHGLVPVAVHGVENPNII